MAVRFRRAEEGDVPTIVRLLADDELGRARERFEEPLPVPYLDAFADIDADPHQLLAVAVDECDAVVGVLQLTFIPSLTFVGSTRAQIEGVRIDASLRGQGVGRAFFEWAIEEARTRGCRLVQLTTNHERPDARRFYESLGFEASHVGMKLDLGPSPRL